MSWNLMQHKSTICTWPFRLKVKIENWKNLNSSINSLAHYHRFFLKAVRLRYDLYSGHIIKIQSNDKDYSIFCFILLMPHCKILINMCGKGWEGKKGQFNTRAWQCDNLKCRTVHWTRQFWDMHHYVNVNLWPSIDTDNLNKFP